MKMIYLGLVAGFTNLKITRLLKSTNNGSKNICDIFDELKMKLKVKSGIILPLKENYTVENFGAVSVWVSDMLNTQNIII